MKFSIFLITLLFSVSSSIGQITAKSYNIVSGKKVSSEIRSGSANGTYVDSMTIQRPRANTSASSLAKINPSLPALLKDYNKLISTAQVSSRFGELYDNKIAGIKKGKFSTEHNFCDCETVLRIKHPSTGRIALWVQADMDVVTDGSDPVRSPKLSDYNLARSSDWYLPETSYRWPKSRSTPRNPLLDYYPQAIKELRQVRAIAVEKQKYDQGVVWREVIKSIDGQIYRLTERGAKDYVKTGLSKNRYLEATKDPFVVLPVPWVNKSAAWAPHIGDYAAVIYKNRIYPAILGDAGPSDKVGEASLRIAQALNPKASGRYRAVSDVSVSYIIFPKTAGPRTAPNYSAWRSKVAALLNDLGGYSTSALHTW